MSLVQRFASPIDLHTHSRVSDGTESPHDLVRAAKEAGLGTVALTDHDSVEGWAEASASAREQRITFVPGMELSTRVGRTSVHMLAYLFDPADAALRDETRRIREARRTRAENMVARIGRDYDFHWEDVLAQSAVGTTLGRPHIADALVARGHAISRQDAFAGILSFRHGYYEPHYAPDPVTGVRMIRAAGGVPVIAHPATRGIDSVVDEDGLKELIDAGLAGLEIDHPENRPDGMVRLRELAAKYDLIVTGSSDYHGTGKVNRLGECTTAPHELQRIIEQATGIAPVYPD